MERFCHSIGWCCVGTFSYCRYFIFKAKVELRVGEEVLQGRKTFLAVFVVVGFVMKMVAEFVHEICGHGLFVLLFGGNDKSSIYQRFVALRTFTHRLVFTKQH
jgi:hypothetical protein